MPRSALPQASEKSKSSAKKMFPTHSLMEQPLFRNRNRILRLSPADRIQLSFARAREVISAYGINIADLQDVSSRVWRMHCDPIWSLDGAAGTIATIHVNLVMGTLAKFQHLPHVSQLLQKMLNFEVNGQYCLTELGHGLDVFALETRVDLTAEGDFRLNTPNPRAAKYMPPTTPCGYPVTAVVFARLFVRGHDHGIKPFIVPIHDGTCMYQGVSSTALHLRGGSNPVLHALTSFRNVRLPSTALLGSIDRATDQKTAFFSQIDRVVSGTLVMGGLAAMGVGMSASIVSAYSHRRHVSDPVTGKPIPIISFPTQITPILTAVAQSHVLHAYGESTRQQFGQTETITQRHFLAAVWKVTAARMAMASMQVLIDRCGAQGLFEINQLTTMLADLRGSAVAEGDIQALAIRFAVDVLLGRVEMTDPVDDSSLLARHEQGVLTELMGVLAGLKNPRREMAAVVLPQAFRIIESIGHRMAVDAARHAGVDCRLIAVFEAGVIHCDPAWYSENGISHVEQARIEREAIEAAAPALRDFVQDLGMEGHIQAPIFSDEKWDEYVSQLDTFEAPAVGHQQTSEDRLAPVWGGSQIQFTAAKL